MAADGGGGGGGHFGGGAGGTNRWTVGGVWGMHVSWNGEPRKETVKVCRWQRFPWLPFTRDEEITTRTWYSHGHQPRVGDLIHHMPDAGDRGNEYVVTRSERQTDPPDMVVGSARFVRTIAVSEAAAMPDARFGSSSDWLL